MTSKWYRSVTARRALSCLVLATVFGCTHSRPDPFVRTDVEPLGPTASLDPCFTTPLEGCITSAYDSSDDEFPGRWRLPFQPDLHARLCRGDKDARGRMHDFVRQLDEEQESERGEQWALVLMGDCSSDEFCSWAVSIAEDPNESTFTRNLFLEVARRECTDPVDVQRLQEAGAALGRSISEEPPWRTNSRDVHCADIERSRDPWDDLVNLRATGCLDLLDWMSSHRDAPDETASALERCVTGSEIRYREADCLRELAGLDRERAVALVRDEGRRGWGLSSSVTRYAKTLSRFPARGQLEAELMNRGLIPASYRSEMPDGGAAILASEILEANGVLHRFNPSCPPRYCEHAPLVYDLIALASPDLDDLVIVERWPALDEVDMGSGPRAVAASVRGIPATFHVDKGTNDAIDRDQLDALTQAAEVALSEPHELVIHTRKSAHRLALLNLDTFYDLESIIGGLNTILAARDSELRFVSLAPHCSPCSQILVGPRDGLIDASISGLIEVVDPFNVLWGRPGFAADAVAPEP